MLMVDLAVPRDIDPKVESLDNVYLYGVDDLQSVIDENLAQRRQTAVEAKIMVNQLAAQLMTQQKVKEASSTIQAYRQHSEEVSQRVGTCIRVIATWSCRRTGDAGRFAHRLSQKTYAPNFYFIKRSC